MEKEDIIKTSFLFAMIWGYSSMGKKAHYIKTK